MRRFGTTLAVVLAVMMGPALAGTASAEPLVLDDFSQPAGDATFSTTTSMSFIQPGANIPAWGRLFDLTANNPANPGVDRVTATQFSDPTSGEAYLDLSATEGARIGFRIQYDFSVTNLLDLSSTQVFRADLLAFEPGEAAPVGLEMLVVLTDVNGQSIAPPNSNGLVNTAGPRNIYMDFDLSGIAHPGDVAFDFTRVSQVRFLLAAQPGSSLRLANLRFDSEIPEPASLALVGVAWVGLLLRRRG